MSLIYMYQSSFRLTVEREREKERVCVPRARISEINDYVSPETYRCIWTRVRLLPLSHATEMDSMGNGEIRRDNERRSHANSAPPSYVRSYCYPRIRYSSRLSVIAIAGRSSRNEKAQWPVGRLSVCRNGLVVRSPHVTLICIKPGPRARDRPRPISGLIKPRITAKRELRL